MAEICLFIYILFVDLNFFEGFNEVNIKAIGPFR